MSEYPLPRNDRASTRPAVDPAVLNLHKAAGLIEHRWFPLVIDTGRNGA